MVKASVEFKLKKGDTVVIDEEVKMEDGSFTVLKPLVAALCTELEEMIKKEIDTW